MELFRNDYFSITHDASAAALKIAWTEKTAEMGVEDFKDALRRLAGHAEEHGAHRLLVDVTRFRFAVGPEIGPWRGHEITPRYNAAGVAKFAYVFPEGADLPPSSAEAPEAYSGEDFATRFFHSEDSARAWFAED